MLSRRGPRSTLYLALCATFVFVPALSWSQADAHSEPVFAPFASRVRLAIADPRVRITWADAEAVLSDYRIYRSTEPITTETLGEAELIGTADPGDEGFIDVPPAPGEYFYAVVAENPAGDPYPVIIPGRNASYRAVEIENLATEVERAARVRGLDAALVRAEGRSAIEVTAVATREGRTIAVYRSTEPIAAESDLADASLVREVPSESPRLVDLPVPGVGYYYAAVDAGLLLAGGLEITPGENATLEPTTIPLSTTPDEPARREAESTEGRPAPQPGIADEQQPEAIADDQRPIDVPPEADLQVVFEPEATPDRGVPLPFLRLQTRLATGRRLGDPRILIPERSQLRPEAEKAVASLLARLEPERSTAPEPTILSDDRLPDPEGAEYTLRTILDGPFRRMAWESALEQIQNYLTLPLTPELEARAHFYRAQIHYFLGDRRRAVLEFLLARDAYYVEVERWLDRILGNSGA
ncbi:MAG: hypothetical protein ACOC2D_08470 [Spirochaetota bacterium]